MVAMAWCYNAQTQAMQTLLALDLETTGLNPDRDTIIEIGAVRFRGTRVEEEWSTLVNPGRPLDPTIKALTGISDEMLANAPRLNQILGEFRDFVGDLPVLGHNVRFDLSFLHPRGLLQNNPTLDTFDIASVLLPTAGRYSLGSLASALAIPVRTSHRALQDAQTTRLIFMRLYERALELPREVIEEVSIAGAEIEWGAGWLFDLVLEQFESVESSTELPRKKLSFLFTPPRSHPEPLSPREHPEPLDVEEIAAILEPGGSFAKKFPAYEHRPQQITMTRAITEALSKSRHLLVEAGTGTGKSMAYLVPALAWAASNGERVVVSTNTINLQDQLIHKDIPDLCETLGVAYRAAVLKGRSNYLCPRRLESMRQLGPRTAEEIRLLAKMLVWLHNGGTGDRSEINLSSRELAVWSSFSAEGEDCSADACLEHVDGACPYFKAHLLAENAHVVVVNHALLLADIATGNRVIPEYRYLIVDEAHHLESATTRGLSFRVSQREVLYLLRDLGSHNSGLLGQILDMARKEFPGNDLSSAEEIMRSVSEKLKDCTQLANSLFDVLSEFLSVQREGKPVGPYGQRIRILPASRTLPKWSDVEIAWEGMRNPLASIVDSVSGFSESLDDVASSVSAENLATAVRISLRNLEEIYTNLDHMIFEPDPQTIYWIETRFGSNELLFHAAPLDVGPLIERFLWHEKEAIVMTSATLTVGGEFEYIQERLNGEDADVLALGSPFDFETSTLLYLIDDIPEPTDRKGYQRAVEKALTMLCRATRGRTLALFTSNAQLYQTARAIAAPLGREGIEVFEQTSGASRHALLERFRTTEQAVLLGTRSYWEGVDVPGEALSVLVIVRLPFDVPDDPIIAARAETFESPFQDYNLPEAVLRFRQGFGRLIRTQYDRGIVVILDRRVLSKSYGSAFLDSIPRCTLRKDPLADLPAAATRWLGI
ncbi:MAG: DEAD/DEAH box helicase family protein [Anaerolineales bacterium]|nr:DEAD/DEAH box helicase family protein [Anaerolineales bacterium]